MSSVRATPAARRLAAVKNVDLSKVTGTGITNYIKAVDVSHPVTTFKITHVAQKMLNFNNIAVEQLGAIEDKRIDKKTVLAFLADSGKKEQYKQDVQNGNRKFSKKLPLNGMRKVIAQRMSGSLETAPQYTLFSDIDVTRVQNLISELNKQEQALTGSKITVTDIMIKLIAAAVKKHPIINSSIIADEICFHDIVNIGIAVALEDGLIVPNIKNADEKSLSTISAERKDLVERARKSKLKPDEYSGGTFTISNLGMFPIDYSTPIINQPESGIIGLGRICEKVAAVNGKVEIRPVIGISLTLDHRHIDGVVGARFIATVREFFENPYGICLKW